jgi:C1A family cysteine protease
VNRDQLRKAMENKGVEWEIAPEPVAAEQRLGYVPSAGAGSLEEQEARAKELAEAAEEEKAPSYPQRYDLRDVDGKNFITRVKDQGACGSCVAFGSCATVEGTLRVQEADPDLDIDLSEAQLFYCAAADTGSMCADGWYPKVALAVFKNAGVPPEATFPYTPGDQPCSVSDDWREQAVKINDWHRLERPADMKAWIAERGPAVGSMSVYEDFQLYAGGIYRQVAGNKLGGHCICVVGYDDGEGYWIIKNSWDTGWGERGFARIAYGEVGLDSGMLGVAGVLVPETVNVA